MKKSHALAIVPMILAGAACAEPATQEGADHLVSVFQTYLGPTEGVVSVTPDGETYSVMLDLAPFFAMAKDSGMTGSVTPLELTLTDNGDGTWDVAQDQELQIAMAAPGAMDMTQDIGSFIMDGVFDETLMTFSSAEGQMQDIKVTQVMQAPGQPDSTMEAAFASATFKSTGVANAAGGADVVTSVALNGMTETLTTPPTDGAPGMPITVKVDTITEDLTGTGFKMDGVLQVVAWVVAHPDQAAIEADKAGLKTVLTAALPFFTTLSGTGVASKIAVTTPMGDVALDEVAFAVEANGAVADGKFREAFTLSGLTLPAGIVPDWAAPILPQKMSVDVQVTDFDAAAAVTTAMGLLDLPAGATPPPEFDAQLQAALMPKGTVTIGLNPGEVTGTGYALTYEGSMVAGAAGAMPTGTAKITLTGIDVLNAAIAAAPDDVKGQAMMGVGMAQGMAKPGDNGALVWEIDAMTPGVVSVNGTPVFGGQ